MLYAAGLFGKERTIKEKVRKCRKPLENIYPSLLGRDAAAPLPSPSYINGICTLYNHKKESFLCQDCFPFSLEYLVAGKLVPDI